MTLFAFFLHLAIESRNPSSIFGQDYARGFGIPEQRFGRPINEEEDEFEGDDDDDDERYPGGSSCSADCCDRDCECDDCLRCSEAGGAEEDTLIFRAAAG